MRLQAERRQRRQRRMRCELQRLRALLAGGPPEELSAPLLAPLPPEAACTREGLRTSLHPSAAPTPLDHARSLRYCFVAGCCLRVNRIAGVPLQSRCHNTCI